MENSKTACHPKILVTSCLQEVALYESWFQLEGFDLEYFGVLDVK